MILKIKKLKEDAKAPSYSYEGDAGLDIFSYEEFVLKPGERKTVSTAIAIEFPKGYVALVWDKSGVASKFGIKSMGGVIDSHYRGELKIVMFNTSSQDYAVKKGDKIVQLLIQPVEHAELKVLSQDEELSSTERGEKGFGSSGKC